MTAPTVPTGDFADRHLADLAAGAADAVHRAGTSADVLAGLIAAGMLRTVQRPEQLPELMWPQIDPAVVRDIWAAAIAVGVRVGRTLAGPQWEPVELDRANAALYAAGYTSMARAVEAAAYAAPSRTPPPAAAAATVPVHPADTNPPARRHA